MIKNSFFNLIFMIPTFVMLNFISSCQMNVSEGPSYSSYAKNSKPSWTFLIYMAADNELESAALADINEMENVDLPSNVNIIVILDRIPGYDSSNGDWTETRIYKIEKDTNLSNISSTQLNCEDLELSLEHENELDMGNRSTLSRCLRFIKREFSAENYGLVIWGHGSGWRGFSEDNTNSSMLSLGNLRLGIEDAFNGEKLDFLGFDTCFGATIEVAFEMRSCAEIMSGTPGIVSEEGWNYNMLFTDFIESEMTPENFSESCKNQFEKNYSDYQYGAFCSINLSEVENLVASFDEFAKKSSAKISSFTIRNEIFNLIEKNSVSYLSSSVPTDFYVDILSFEKNVSKSLKDDEVLLAGKNLEKALNSAILSSWNACGGCSLSVFFGYYKSQGIFSLSHPSNYVNGSRDSEICKFVSSCVSYVPTKNKSGSFIDKMFYAEF